MAPDLPMLDAGSSSAHGELLELALLHNFKEAMGRGQNSCLGQASGTVPLMPFFPDASGCTFGTKTAPQKCLMHMSQAKVPLRKFSCKADCSLKGLRSGGGRPEAQLFTGVQGLLLHRLKSGQILGSPFRDLWSRLVQQSAKGPQHGILQVISIDNERWVHCLPSSDADP